MKIIFQYLSETVGAAEATKLDDAYMDMERVSVAFLPILFTSRLHLQRFKRKIESIHARLTARDGSLNKTFLCSNCSVNKILSFYACLWSQSLCNFRNFPFNCQFYFYLT